MGLHRKESRKKILAFGVALLLAAGTLNLPAHTYAAPLGTGVIIYTEEGEWIVDTKASPSPDAERVNRLEEGKPLTILKQVTGTDGKVWYQVSYVLKLNGQTVTAYVPAEKVKLDAPLATDTPVVIATGTINGMNVFVRDGAGTSGTTMLVSLDRGHKVDIYGQTTVSGTVWYNVSCVKNGQTYTGWTSGAYIVLDTPQVDVTGDFAESLRKGGFPESYIAPLVRLHEKYPSWKFVAVDTGLSWDTVIAEESKNGRNLVSSGANDAQKSTAAGAYNWNTNTWTIYDGSSWVAAHPDYIAYRMDPRNYLDETNIFQFESLSYSPDQTLTGVKAILSGTFMERDVRDADGKNLNYASTFMSTGKDAGVSPYHLASRVRQEQGVNGTSPLISGTYAGYEGYFNYYNFGAYGSGSDTVYKNGLEFAKKQGWNTRYKALLGGANRLGENYIKKGQDTLYFQKFDVIGPEYYDHQYMQNVNAAVSEGQSVAKAYTDKQQPFVFRIPVYRNMPAAAVTFTASGNPNNYLKTLSVTGLSLTPAFSSGTTAYSMVVENGIRSVNVAATAVSGKATITGTGSYNLAVGNNTIKVNCKSESGVTKTYTITVARKEAPAGETPPATDPETPGTDFGVTSATYKFGTYVTGVQPETKAADFLSKIQVKNCTVKLVDKNGEEQTGIVGTGNKLLVFAANQTTGNVELKGSYEIVVYGDVNGDGEINIIDMALLNRHIIKISRLKDCYLEAGDTNHSKGELDIVDLAVMNRYVTKLSTIQQ